MPLHTFRRALLVQAASLIAIASGAFGAAAAQDRPPATPGPRTGPSASTQSPDFARPPAGRMGTPSAALPSALPAAPAPEADRVLLTEVVVEAPQGEPARARDGTAMDAAWVRQRLSRLVATQASVSEIVAMVEDLNRAFLAEGYINSGLLIPTQELSPTGAALRLHLVHGALAPLAPSGDLNGLHPGYVRARMTAASATPVNVFALERDFRRLTADPAITRVRANLRATDQPGLAVLDMDVIGADRFDLYLEGANNRSPSVGGERVALGGSVRNLLGFGDLLQGEVGVTEGLTDFTIGFGTPLLSPAWRLDVRAAMNEAEVLEPALADLDIRSEGWSLDAGVTRILVDRPLTPTAAENAAWTPARLVSAGLQISARQSDSFLLDEPFSFAPGSEDGRTETTALRAAFDWTERGETQVWALSATVSQGLAGTESPGGALSPSSNFTALTARASYARLLGIWGLEGRARLTAQVAGGTLYASERLSAGGEATVRGYRENLLLADNGVVGSVEVSRRFALGAPDGAEGVRLGVMRVGLFLDGASLSNAEGPDLEPSSIGSVGLALGWSPRPGIEAQASVAYGFEDLATFRDKDLQDQGVHLRLVVRPLKWFAPRRGI